MCVGGRSGRQKEARALRTGSPKLPTVFLFLLPVEKESKRQNSPQRGADERERERERKHPDSKHVICVTVLGHPYSALNSCWAFLAIQYSATTLLRA